MECAIRTIRKINFNMGAIKVEDTKRIRFSNMAKFMFNEDQAIIFNRLNGQWIKVPKQCYDILELCNKEGLSWSALSESLADDEDREYMKQLIKLLDSMNCLYNDDEKIIENISFAITHRCNLKCIHCMVNAACADDCTEKKVWVGKLDGNTQGCVYYDTAYTPKTTTWW